MARHDSFCKRAVTKSEKSPSRELVTHGPEPDRRTKALKSSCLQSPAWIGYSQKNQVFTSAEVCRTGTDCVTNVLSIVASCAEKGNRRSERNGPNRDPTAFSPDWAEFSVDRTEFSADRAEFSPGSFRQDHDVLADGRVQPAFAESPGRDSVSIPSLEISGSPGSGNCRQPVHTTCP